LWHAVWEELEQRGATIAGVPVSVRAGEGGRIGTITLSRLEGEEPATSSDGPAETSWPTRSRGPVWDRYGQFAGHPWIRGKVTWMLAYRCILIAAQRGGEPFKETVA
jgi:hypothetical protein